MSCARHRNLERALQFVQWLQKWPGETFYSADVEPLRHAHAETRRYWLLSAEQTGLIKFDGWDSIALGGKGRMNLKRWRKI